MPTLNSKRMQYGKAQLLENQVASDPMTQFASWYHHAETAGIAEPYAFTLATCGNDRQPTARILLLRDFNDTGFYFYSHYDSPKGQQLAENPQAQMLFFWHSLEQQIRIQGTVTKLSEAQNQAYFDKRPKDSQIAATVSTPQSGVINSKDALMAAFANAQQQYSQQPVTKPAHWGGYCLHPTQVEFWQGGEHRLHDRLCYAIQPTGDWQVSRLMP